MNYTNISNDELRALIASTSDLQVIDVRTADELRETGHLPQAQHHPVQTIQNWAPLLDKDTPIAFLCRSGVRSVYACDYMVQALGVDPEKTKLYNLQYGMSEWDGERALDHDMLEEL
jgi:rhodanese-related sulfurtransferase